MSSPESSRPSLFLSHNLNIRFSAFTQAGFNACGAMSMFRGVICGHVHGRGSRTGVPWDGVLPFGRNRTPQRHSETSWLNTPHKLRLPGTNFRWGADEEKEQTLNSFIIGTISSSSASLVTSPPLRSILFPIRMTGIFTPS